RECAAALAEMKKVIEHVRDLEAVEPPAWMTQKIMARVREEARSRKGILHRLFYPLNIKLPIEAVAALLVVGLALYIYRDIRPEMRLAKAPSEESSPQTVQREVIKEDRIGPIAKSVEKDIPQEVTTVPEKPAQESVAGKMEAKADKIEAVSEGKAQAEKREAASEPAPVRERERVPAAGAPARDEMHRDVRAAAPKGKLSYLAKRDEKAMAFTIVVKDPETAVREIERILKELEGKGIRVESIGEKKIITSEINSGELRRLVEKLRSVGQVREKDIDVETMKGELGVRIEIVRDSRSN
ncbi:MAG TPA: DUF2275 domain-containing protein, partial [Thermodesulfovibrionales bacterium]|nr:DUF2275 domain-containing protein [Thermodesulfovibrionales bacterium]